MKAQGNGGAPLHGPPGARAVERLLLASARGAEVSGLLRLLERALAGPPDRLRVLTYHRVVEASEGHCPGSPSATPAGFALQMDFLAANYRVVSMEEVLGASRRDRPLPPRAVLLTFDDAYCDFAEQAWPILKRRALPVTLFVPTAFPGNPRLSFWWDRLHGAIAGTGEERVDTPLGALPLRSPEERLACFRALRDRIKELPWRPALELVDGICRELGPGLPPPGVLSWEALRSLAREGVALGAHTRSHAQLDRVPVEEARAEVSGSLEDLRREIGSALPVFAYPSGRHDEQAVRVVAEAGIELAFATGGGVNDLRRGDRLKLRRIHVGPRTTGPVFRARLLGIRPPAGLRRRSTPVSLS